MDRGEAVLRELKLYPRWVGRDAGAREAQDSAAVEGGGELPVVESAAMPIAAESGDDKTRAGDSLQQAGEIVAPPSVLPTVAKDAERRGVVTEPCAEFGGLGWSELKPQVQSCQRCKLRAGCTQTVFGAGDENADWLFVGEGPGVDEDARGEPFVGKAGQLLDNMLGAINLKRGGEVYIANIVKCRPPANRAPEADEVAACLPYLQRQIDLIQPKVIVALGKTAATALLGKDATLKSLRGKVHDYRGTALVITYHPAYLLRSPADKASAWQDLRLALAVMRKES